MIISIIVALHVIPIAVVLLFLTGVFHFSPTPEADTRPEVVVVKTVHSAPKAVVAAKTTPPPPKPPDPPDNTWDLPPVLPPAGLQSLIISGANPPLPTGGGPLPAKIAPLIRDFESKHVGPVFGLALLPGGKFLLSGGADGHIRAWDTATAKQVKMFGGPPHLIRCLAVNGFGNIAASGGDDGVVRVWDVARGKEAFELRGHAGPVRGIAFSPNGGYILSGGEDGDLRLWDVQNKEAVRNLKLGQPVSCVAFCADGRRALAGGDSGAIAVFDLEAARRLHAVPGHMGAGVASVTFSPDGREAVSVGSDKRLHLWDVVTLTRLKIGGEKGPTGIAFSEPPQAVAYAGDGSWVVAVMADSSAAVVQTQGIGRAKISNPPLGKPLTMAVAPGGSAVYIGTDRGAVRRMDFDGGADFISTGAVNTDKKHEPLDAETKNRNH